MDDKNKPDQTFESAYSRLEEIACELEGDNLSLDHSIELYEEGTKLVALCQKMLDVAEKKIKVIKITENGYETKEEMVE